MLIYSLFIHHENDGPSSSETVPENNERSYFKNRKDVTHRRRC